jgi:exodeoxyribonuclease VII small subunit
MRSRVATIDPIDPMTPSMSASDPTPDPTVDALSFDDALAELQRTVAELESGGQPLEQAIALYERGVALQARCERLLSAAELRVQQLVARAGGALETRDVRPEEGADANGA